MADDSFDIEEVRGLWSPAGNADWESVADEVIEWRADSLAFLSPKAFRYYLPAYIVYTLKNPNSERPVLPFLVYSLMNTFISEITPSERRVTYERRVEILSLSQKLAVLKF